MGEISVREFLEWIEYYKLEPFGEEREDLRMGVIASTIANVNRSKKSDRVFKPEDFFPKFNKQKQSWQEQLRIAEILNMAFGGRDLRKNNGA